MCRPGRVYCYSTRSDAPTDVRHPNGSTRKSTKTPIFKRSLDPVHRFIITGAQNATPVHALGLKSLEKACNHANAELLVVPLRYKNPTSRWSASQANEETWAPEITPYLWNVRRKLNENLSLLADIKTQPTASSPLTGFDAVSGTASAILGHTKMQLRSIATPQNKMAKLLSTTGVITLPNYTDSKAGKLGEFHHSLSALIVEIQGKTFHLRQLHVDRVTGEFTDLGIRYTPEGAKLAPRPLALVMGDTHVGSIDPAVERATHLKGGIVPTLKPQHLIWHDLLDGYAVNPHVRGNPFAAAAKFFGKKSDVEAEVYAALDYLADHTRGDALSVVVPSNHDDFLQRWAITHDWRTDPENAEFYLKTALALHRAARGAGDQAERLSAFGYWVHERFKRSSNIRCLHIDEPFSLGNVALEMHGDRGPNGARGSILNLRRIGLRSIVGHSHSPGIDEGCYQVGTSTRLRLGYNAGPSSWLNTHCLLHADGARQLINIINGEWRLA